MAGLSHGARHLKQGIGVHRHGPVPAHTTRSIHIPAAAPRPAPPPSTAQRLVSASRSFLTRLVSHLTTPGTFTVPVQPSFTRPTHFSNTQTIKASFSLPVKHALSRPFSPPRLPKPPVVPANVSHVGLGTARAFHSGRPIFQNMVDNVPIATRALWEAEWDVKMKQKEGRRMRRATQNKAAPQSQEMLKPKPKPLATEPSELDVYFPLAATPAVTTHLLVPLAPTPTARLPLSTRTDGGGAHPLLPISELASIHTGHRLHSLRVSTLFARLDGANVWDDPGVNVDAYAFGPRHDAQEKQCTILRVTFRGWSAHRVRAILGDSAEWYSLEETHLDGRPTVAPSPGTTQDVQDAHLNMPPQSPSLDSSWACEPEMDDEGDALPPLPMRASASAEHDLVLPTLDFSSVFADTANNVPSPPQPVIILRTVSELTHDAELSSVSTTPFVPSRDSSTDDSWERLALSSSFVERVDGQYWDGVAMDM